MEGAEQELSKAKSLNQKDIRQPQRREVSGGRELQTQASSPDVRLREGCRAARSGAVEEPEGTTVLRRSRNNATPVTTDKATSRSEPGKLRQSRSVAFRTSKITANGATQT